MTDSDPVFAANLEFYRAFMQSWEGILANPDAPRVACFDEQVFLYGDVALVLCEEELVGGTLAASNLFVREDNEWRIAQAKLSSAFRSAWSMLSRAFGVSQQFIQSRGAI